MKHLDGVMIGLLIFAGTVAAAILVVWFKDYLKRRRRLNAYLEAVEHFLESMRKF